MMRALILLCTLLALPAQAAIDTYEFRDDETRERFQVLTEELRCPKCQNQNLADSNSPIAKDLRHEVYRMLDKGESDQNIADFMVARYGEFVLYKPRKDTSTYVLWYGPFALLLIGLLVVLVMTRKKKAAPSQDDADQSDRLAAEERDKLNSLLGQDKDK